MSNTGKGQYVPALGFGWSTPAFEVVVDATMRERRFEQALRDQAALTGGRRVLHNKQTSSQAVRSFAA